MRIFSFLSKRKPPSAKIDYNKYFSLAQSGSSDYEVFSPGELVLPSGRISVCDPLAYIWELNQLDREVQPGKYKVKILVAKNSLMSERYAFAMLEISSAPVVNWELAVTAQQRKEIGKLEAKQFFGFPVDAGMGCFVDAATQQIAIEFLDEFLKTTDRGNIYDDLFAPMFKKNAKNQSDPNDVGDWLVFEVPKSGANIIMFQSGFGDGVYPSYWGISENKKIAALLIDFLILENDV